MLIPSCDYRIATKKDGTYFCRHTRVRSAGSLVTGNICRTCQWCQKPCAQPRPVPADPLERRADDQPQRPPPMLRRVWSLATALKDFVADGLATVTAEQYEERLKICDGCDQRNGNWCAKCGCSLSVKARGRAFQCPLDKWPSADEEQGD